MNRHSTSRQSTPGAMSTNGWVAGAMLAAVVCLSASGLARAAGELPPDLRPSHYRLHFSPAKDLRSFAGEGEMSFVAEREFSRVVLHADGLKISQAVLQPGNLKLRVRQAKQSDVLELHLPKPLAAGSYQLQMRWQGNIGEQARGWYRLKYNTPAGEKLLLASQQEPTYARRMFPSWDEPAFRATFAVSADVPANWRAVANGAVAAREPLADGRQRIRFATSPNMSTYLLALFMGEFEQLERRNGPYALSLHTVAGKTASGEFAMQETGRILDEYERYFGVPYGLSKLDQIAVPGGSGGTMENWGAISYNERALLYTPGVDSPDKQFRIFNILAHEIAHQWFGNLVTVAWWDNLWIKEAFATWIAADVATRLHPDWQGWLRQDRWTEEARQRDAQPSSTPIRRPVRHRDEIRAAYDSLTYEKGAAVIRMLENLLGAEAFRAGLHDYMTQHAYGAVVTDDLWRRLPPAGEVPALAIARDWIDQPGLPIVSARQQCANGETRLELHQQRFLNVASPTADQAAAQTWRIPLVLQRGEERRSVLLSEPQMVVSWPGCQGWVNLNAAGIGYYRSQYDEAGWQAMLPLWPTLAVTDQMNLLVDSFATLGTAFGDWGRYRQLVAKLADSSEPMLLTVLVDQFDDIDAALPAARRAEFHRFALPELRRILDRIGLTPPPDEPAVVAELRNRLANVMSAMNDPSIIAWARQRFGEFRTDSGADSSSAGKAAPDPRLRDAVYSVMGRHADPSEQKVFWQLLKTGQSQDEMRRALQLCQHRSPEVAAQFMAATLDGRIPAYITARPLSCVAREHPEQTWRFMTSAWPKLAKVAGDFAMEVIFEGVGMYQTEAQGIPAEQAWAPRIGVRSQPVAERVADNIRRHARLAEAVLL